ncbi:GBF-interacting protein 1-like isoform X3 [Carica papaya]|nr:GBF-interacting protein 1-like isoform X3 [Carica papaya]
MPGRGARGGRGNYSSNYNSFDAGGRNAAAKKENGVNPIAERSSMPSLPAPHKAKNNAVPRVTKSQGAVSNSVSALTNGSSGECHGPQSSGAGTCHGNLVSSAVDVVKVGTTQVQPVVAEQLTSGANPTFVSVVRVDQEKLSSKLDPPLVPATPMSGVYASASDPVLAPSLSCLLTAIGTVKHEVGSQQKVAEPNHAQGNKHVSPDIDSEMLKSENETPGVSSNVHGRGSSNKSKPVERNQPSESLTSPSSTQVDSLIINSKDDRPVEEVTMEVGNVADKANTKLPPESNVADGPHVTFPLHFQVAEALKNGLTFGSFDSTFMVGIKEANDTTNDIRSIRDVEPSIGNSEAAGEPFACSQSESLTAVGDNHSNPESPPPMLEQIPESDVITSSEEDLKSDQLKQEVLLDMEEHQNSTVHNVRSYNFGFAPLSGSQLAQIETTESVSSSDLSSSSPTPALQNSIPASQHQVPLFRQPYPPNFFSYGHYLSPYFVPPMHQILGHNGLPQQPSTANLYLPAGAAAPGVKFPIPQLKQGANAGNPAHVGIPSAYGSYGSSHVGFSHVPAVTSGNSTSNEDLGPAQLKENIYTTVPLSEGSALWMHAPGQDLSSLQVNSFYNLPIHAQHPLFSPAQAGHGAFGGIYQQPQTLAAPNANPLLQQSQVMARAVETAGPPATAYQQPQLAQMNWNTNY